MLLFRLLDEPDEIGMQSIGARSGRNGLGLGLGLGICRSHEGVFRGMLMSWKTPAYPEDPLTTNFHS